MDRLTFHVNVEASADIIWDIWADLEASTAWDKAVVSCRLEGPFSPGTRGICKLKNGLSMPIELEDMVVGHRWNNSARLLGKTLCFIHEVDVVSSGTCRVMHQVDLSQVTPWLWRKVLKIILRPALSDSLTNLKYFAEQRALTSIAANLN